MPTLVVDVPLPTRTPSGSDPFSGPDRREGPGPLVVRPSLRPFLFSESRPDRESFPLKFPPPSPYRDGELVGQVDPEFRVPPVQFQGSTQDPFPSRSDVIGDPVAYKTPSYEEMGDGLPSVPAKPPNPEWARRAKLQGWQRYKEDHPAEFYWINMNEGMYGWKGLDSYDPVKDGPRRRP